MDIAEVLSKAWKTVWKHKILWLFGILASCGGQNTFNYSLGGNNNNNRPNQGMGNLPVPEWFNRFFEGIERWFEALTGVQVFFFVLIAVVVVLLLFILSVTLSTAGRIGLVRGALRVDGGVETLRFSDLMADVRQYFWRVLGLTVAVFLLSIAVGLVVAFGLLFFGVATLGIGLICLLPFLCILIPLSWLVTVYIEQVYLALLVDNLSIPEAFEKAWEVFSKNLGTMVLMALILVLLIGMVGFGLLAVPFSLAFLPFVAATLAGSAPVIEGTFIFFLVGLALYIPFAIVVGGILRAYMQTAWTLTYVRLTRRPAAPAPAPVPAAPNEMVVLPPAAEIPSETPTPGDSQ